jgi:hypothetical protein
MAVVFNWSDVDVTNGELMVGLAGTSTARFQNTGSNSEYMLVVNSVDSGSGTYGTYLYGPFSIPAGAVHTATLKDWPDCSMLISEIDLNADGVADIINEAVPGIKLDVPLNEQNDADQNGIPDQFDMQQAQAAVTHVASGLDGAQPDYAAPVQGPADASAWGWLVWAIPAFVVVAAGAVVAFVLMRKRKIGRG